MADDAVLEGQVADQQTDTSTDLGSDDQDDLENNEDDSFDSDDDGKSLVDALDRDDSDDDHEGAPGEADLEDEEDLDEDDEDILRGKELLDKQQAADEAAKAGKEGQDQQGQQKETDTGTQQKTTGEVLQSIINEKWDADGVKESFLPFVPKNIFPEGDIKLDDGTVLNFQAALHDIPELPLMMTMVAQNIVHQMAEGGYLATKNHVDSLAKDIPAKLDTRLNMRTITHPVYGVPNAKEIAQSAEFKTWLEGQKPEIQALQKGTAHDYVKLLKRFVNKGVVGDAAKQKAEADKKRQDKKKAFDQVHKSSSRKSKVDMKNSRLTPEAEEDEAFNSDDD